MESINQGITPQFIKTVDYEEDYVKSSMEMSSGKKVSHDKYKSYKSPSRPGYQSRYPASYNNLQRQRQEGYQSISPGRLNGNKEGNNGNNNFSIQNLNYQRGFKNQYTSPSRNNQFIPSPYVNINSPNSYPYQSQGYNSNYENSQFNSGNFKSNIQLQKMVSELKLSLQQSLHSQSSLQDQLHKQKSRTFQLSQIKRKLEQELSKMQFQLDRITNTDILGQRQIYIKYEAQLLQNQRLNSQNNDFLEQLKRVKKQCRQAISQGNRYRNECDLLKSHNAQLIEKLQLMVKQVQGVKNEFNISLAREKRLQQQNQSIRKNNNLSQNQNYGSSNNLNSIVTTRTDNYDSGHLSQYGNQHGMITASGNQHGMIKPNSAFNNKQFGSPQTTKPNSHNFGQREVQHHQANNYEVETSKLLEDYDHLLRQNQSMKKLYKQFYQHSPRQNLTRINSPPQSYNRSISEHSQELESTDQNFYKQINNSPLQTFQKHQLFNQISSLRQEVIQQLLNKYYLSAINEASTKKMNVLVLFIKVLTKNLQTVQKMVINYLQARDILKKQLNLKRLTEGQQSNPTTQSQVSVQQMWQKVKQKLKHQLKSHQIHQSNPQSQVITLNINAYFLALFRLLTLIHKHENNDIQQSSKSLSKLKHSALKYVHKIYQETQMLRHQVNQKKHSQKFSLKR